MIYLDSAATTLILPQVIDEMQKSIKNIFANPSSLHKLGFISEQLIDKSRKEIANTLNIPSKNIFFTSGATEANNWAIESSWQKRKNRGQIIFATEDAHPSIKEKIVSMKEKGANVKICPINENGLIDIVFLEENLDSNVIFFSILAVNNETGVIQDISRLIEIIRRKSKNCFIHLDAVQAFCKTDITKFYKNADLISLSSHKIGGPKGIGALIINHIQDFPALLLGGGQENNKRAGTENLIGIIGFAKAAQIMKKESQINYEKISRFKVLLENNISNSVKDCQINGIESNRSPYITSISIKNIKAEVLLHSLSQDDIYISTKTACSSKNNQGSHVLEAMKIQKDFLEGTIRISYFPTLSIEDIDVACDKIIKTIKSLRSKFN